MHMLAHTHVRGLSSHLPQWESARGELVLLDMGVVGEGCRAERDRVFPLAICKLLQGRMAGWRAAGDRVG